MKYEHECCRCGACCLFETCPVGRAHYRIKKKGICPALSFSSDGVASCKLAGALVPVGDGCCISARIFKDGKEIQFASLHPLLKKEIVKNIINNFQNKINCSYCGKTMYLINKSHNKCPNCNEVIDRSEE